MNIVWFDNKQSYRIGFFGNDFTIIALDGIKEIDLKLHRIEAILE